MTSPFVPLDASAWPFIADALTKPWPREAVLFDLRWWEDQERVGREKRPGRPALCARWGWPQKRVRILLDDRGQRGASEGPAATRTNAENQAKRASEGPARGQRQLPIPLSKITETQITEQQHAPGGASGPDPVQVVYSAWHHHHPTAPDQPTPARAQRIRRAIEEATPEGVVLVLDYVHRPGSWWLQNGRTGLETILSWGVTRNVTFSGLLEEARAWDAAGRREGGKTSPDGGNAPHPTTWWFGRGPMPDSAALDLWATYAATVRESGPEVVVGIVCTGEEWAQAEAAARRRTDAEVKRGLVLAGPW